jgi:15-cis-phytoene synthase
MLQLSRPARMKPSASLEQSYELCRTLTAQYAKTFYLASLTMTEAKRNAIWAIYAWCRRTDELVDGPAATDTTLMTLDQWEAQLESVFTGIPCDDWDVALVDTLERFPAEIQPFRDMIAGQRMDLNRSRYETFEELHLYCYRVAGTVGLMSTGVMGLDIPRSLTPWHQNQQSSDPSAEAVALGIAAQLTNILRDVGEDAQRGRIYLPLADLELFGYREQDLFQGVVDDRWRNFMRFQIQRARKYYAQAEKGINRLSEDARWPVWAAAMLYSRILNAIERNDYDVFRKRAYVSNIRKVLSLPTALLRARVL